MEEEEFKPDYGRRAFFKAEENTLRIQNLENMALTRQKQLQIHGSEAEYSDGGKTAHISADFKNTGVSDIMFCVELITADTGTVNIDISLDTAKIHSTAGAGGFITFSRLLRGVNAGPHTLNIVVRTAVTEGLKSYTVTLTGDFLQQKAVKNSVLAGSRGGTRAALSKTEDEAAALYRAELPAGAPVKVRDFNSTACIPVIPSGSAQNTVCFILDGGRLYMADGAASAAAQKRELARDVSFAAAAEGQNGGQGAVFYIRNKLLCRRKLMRTGERSQIKEEEIFPLPAASGKIAALFAGGDGYEAFLYYNSGDLYALRKTQSEAFPADSEGIKVKCGISAAFLNSGVS